MYILVQSFCPLTQTFGGFPLNFVNQFGHFFPEQGYDSQKVLNIANQKLKTEFHIYHSTIQVELYQETVMTNCSECQDLQDWSWYCKQRAKPCALPLTALHGSVNSSEVLDCKQAFNFFFFSTEFFGLSVSFIVTISNNVSAKFGKSI